MTRLAGRERSAGHLRIPSPAGAAGQKQWRHHEANRTCHATHDGHGGRHQAAGRPVPATTSRLASARARKDAASAAAAAVRREVTSSSASGTPVRASCST